MGGGSNAEPGHVGEIVSLSWLGNPQTNWRRFPGGEECLDCCFVTYPDKQLKIDGWIEGWIDKSLTTCWLIYTSVLVMLCK